MIIFDFLAPSRRGDLEILGYVMLHWLCSRLPWEDNLNDKEYVKQQKIMYVLPNFILIQLKLVNLEIKSLVTIITFI